MNAETGEKNHCMQCGADNPAGARFCNQCGAPQTAAPAPAGYTPRHLAERVLKHRSAMEGERKQVTVLFADMAGSTRIAEQLDAEDWHRVLDQFFSILSEEIHRFEGTINQFTGDGVMALFGAPLALEDHAQRAARAAWALKGRLRTFADELRLEYAINPSTRMGLNSGEVVVGRIGDDLRMDYTAKGLTVNLAARMEQIAEPGSVYLTRYTADLIEDYFSLRALGPMKVRGQAEPVPVFALEGPTDVHLRLEASRERGLTGFAGRDQELAELQDALDDTQRQVRVLVGDAGLGKSRLCFEAVTRWRSARIPVLTCSGVPHGQAVPLQPVRDLVLQRFEVQRGETPAQARQKIAGGVLLLNRELSEQLPLMFEFLGVTDPQAPPLNLPPEVRDQKIRELFREVCLLDSDRQRVVLVEDLHWLDDGSQDFFRILLECTGCTRTLLVFNTRPGPLPDWLAASHPRQIVLQPLTREAMAQITRSLLGSREELRQLSDRIAAQAAGNPFYIEETVRSLVSARHLEGNPGDYRLRSAVHDIEIPASVQALIAGRVDKLAATDKALLQAAAVLGQRFDHRLITHLSDLDKADAAQALRRLERGNYLRGDDESTEGQWVFCHPLLQEVVYGSLLRDRRIALHRRTASLLEDYFAASADPRAVAGLAHHYEAAGEAEAAARWNLEMAQLMGQHDVQEDIRCLRKAVDLLGPEPTTTQGRSIAVQAWASLLRIGTFHAVPDLDLEQTYKQARQLAERDDDHALLAELLISNGLLELNHCNADAAVAHAGEAMRLAQDLSDASLESRFRIPILFSYFAAGRLREGLSVLDRRDGGQWHQGRMDEDNMLSRGFRALMLAFRGELAVAERESRQAIALAEQHEVQVSWLYANFVDTLCLRGHVDEVMAFASKAQTIAREFGSPSFMEVAERALAQAYLAQGDAAQACAVLQRSAELVQPPSVGAQFACAHFACLADAHLANGELDEAMRAADLAIEQGEAARQRAWTLRAWIAKARTLITTGRDASEAFRTIEALIDETGAEVYRGDLWTLRAQDGLSRGPDELAKSWARQAIQHWHQCGAPVRAKPLEAQYFGADSPRS